MKQRIEGKLEENPIRAKVVVGIFLVFLLTTLPIAFAVSVNPGSIAVEVSSTTATISWETDTAATGAINYGVATSSLTQEPSTTGETTTHNVAIDDLKSAERYYYNIEATDNAGTYTSTYMNFTTLLDAPQNLEVTAQKDNTITLEWDEVDDAQIYYVFKDNTYLDISSTEEYALEELTYDTTYTFYITAVDQYGRQSEVSNEITVEIGEEPVEITFVQATSISKNQAVISWNLEREEDGTVLYGVKEDNLDMSVTDSDQRTEHKLYLKNLEAETTYYYTVMSGATTHNVVQSFTTLGNETAVVFKNIEINDVTRSTAEVSWTTNVETRGSIYYSTDDSFSQYVKEDTDEVTHSEQLEELLSGTTYYLKLVVDETESDIFEFTTSESLYDFIDLEDVPKLWNSPALTLKGTTAENAKLYVFVNKESNPYAQVMMDINGTYFEAEIRLNPYNYIDDIKGRNKVEIHSWDIDNNKAVKIVTIDVDTVSPALSVTEFETWTNKDELNITGYTDIDTTITVYVDEKKKNAVYVDDSTNEFGNTGYFEIVAGVGTASKAHNLTVEAMDAAGNTAKYTKVIHVDRQDPKVTFFTSFTESTHYKLFRVDGQTEPNAFIAVTNFGEYSGCDDVNFQTKYGDCDYLASSSSAGPHQTLDMLLDPTSLMVDLLDLGVGIPTTTVADDDGNFSIIVSLQPATTNTEWAQSSTSSVPDAKIKAAKNTLVFNVSDLAGNEYDTKKQIKYEPSCVDWTIAKTTTFPMNIYTQDLAGGDVLGSALFEVRYIGSGRPEMSKITVQEDTSGGNQIVREGDFELGTTSSAYYRQSYGGLENSNEFITVSAQDVKHTEYDNGKVYLYVPVQINRYRDSPESLPEQFGVYFDAYLSYTDGQGQVSSCHLYPAVSYDIQKPETISKWLSPTMINETIQFLDDTINVTESAVHYLGLASRWTLVGCGGMIAWNYAKGFSGNTLDENQCNTDLKKVYAVCDRILCPSIGRNCEEFEPTGDLLYGGTSCSASDATCRSGFENAKASNEVIEQKLGTEYNEHKKIKPDDSFTDFYENTQTASHQAAIKAADPSGNYDAQLYGSYSYEVVDPTTNQAVTVEYMNLDDDYNSRMTVDEALRQDVVNCGSGTESIIRVTGLEKTESSFLDLSGYGQKVHTQEGQEIYCSNERKENLEDPTTAMIPGCYSEECPQFDKSKCLFGPGYGVSPAQGLFASLQCGCLTGAKAHLENLLKMLYGAKKCFQQVLLGDQTAGYCERLMSYFVCDILTEIFKHLFRSLEQGVGPLAGLYGDEQLQNYQENAQSVRNGLTNRYGDIVKDNAAFATENLINKACIAAFTADWSVLEGVLDTMVESIYVEPIATISGTSRPYGFDPFSGRITMAYNIYTGVFPGGPTKVEAWLECDKSLPNAMCAEGETNKIDLVAAGKVPAYMDEDDFFDENIVVFDNNGKSIFNKAVLVLEYEVSGKVMKEVYEAQLHPRGDITVLGCSFSTMNGIECNLGLEFQDLANGVGGSVTLYDTTQGTSFSPVGTQYYGDNQVAALVKVQNAYPDTFYFRVDTTTDEFEYWAVGGTDSGDYYGQQYYLLWLDSSGSGSSAALSLEDVTDKIDIIDTTQSLWFTLPKEVDEVTLKLTPLEDTGGADTYFEAVRCDLRRVATKSKPASKSKVVGSETYYECIGPTDGEDYIRLSTQIRKDYSDVEYIKGIKFLNLVKASSASISVGDKFKFSMLNGVANGNDYIESEYKSASSSTKSRSAKINVLADTTGDNKGETKIYSVDQDPKDQQFSMSYKVGATVSSTANSKPVIHFIEPEPIIESDTGWVNSIGDAVPLGFTIWDDKNEIETFSIGIVGSNGQKCLATWEYDEAATALPGMLNLKSATKDVDGEPCGLTPTNRFIGLVPDKPPFFEFDLSLGGKDSSGNVFIEVADDVYYDITLHVVDEDGNMGQDRIRRIRFSGSSDDTYGDMLICLGSGGCTGEWMKPSDDVQAIAQGSVQQRQDQQQASSSLSSSEPELVALS